MKDMTFIAKLTGPSAIRVILLSPFGKEDRNDFVLLCDGKIVETLKVYMQIQPLQPYIKKI